jgi:hypothetical protein
MLVALVPNAGQRGGEIVDGELPKPYLSRFSFLDFGDPMHKSQILILDTVYRVIIF